MTFTVYSKPNCPYCDQAKALLKSKGLDYQELILDVGQEKKEGVTYVEVAEIKTKFPNQKTVPVILRGEEFVGGFTELRTLLAKG